MATKICLFSMLPSEKDVIRVVLPFGAGSSVLTFAQGDQVVAETLVTGTRDTYQGALVVTKATEEPAIIMNQNVYKDARGERTGNVENVGEITYKSGDIVTCVRPSKNIPLQLTYEAFSGTPVVGSYLVPQVGATSQQLLVATDLTGVKFGYKIEKIGEALRVGNAFVNTVLVRTIV